MVHNMIKKRLIIGSSHVIGLEFFRSAGFLNDFNSDDIIIGIPALPLFATYLRDKIEEYESKVDYIYLVVPDFRSGNLYFSKNENFKSLFIDNDFDEYFTKYKRFAPIQKNLLSKNIKQQMYKHGIDVLDYFIKKYDKKISFIFWDINTREYQNIKNQKYMHKGNYCHPLWNYSVLLNKYFDNTLDIKILRNTLDEYLADQPGHPNYKASIFLEKLITTEDSQKAYDYCRKIHNLWKTKVFETKILASRILKKETPIAILGSKKAEVFNFLGGFEALPSPISYMSDFHIDIPIPLFCIELKKQIEDKINKGKEVFLFVPKLRFGNIYFQMFNSFESIFVAGDFDPFFVEKYYFSNIEEKYITEENDEKLYKQAIKVLDFFVKEYGDKIHFIFWDMLIEEHIGDKKKNICNYDFFLNRYEKHTLNLKIIKKDILNYYITEDSLNLFKGYPNFRGYIFLWFIIFSRNQNISIQYTKNTSMLKDNILIMEHKILQESINNLLLTARIFVHKNKLDIAKKIIQDILEKKNINKVPTYLELVNIYNKEHNTSAVWDTLDSALAEYPNNPRVRRKRVETHMKSNSWNLARDEMIKIDISYLNEEDSYTFLEIFLQNKDIYAFENYLKETDVSWDNNNVELLIKYIMFKIDIEKSSAVLKIIQKLIKNVLDKEFFLQQLLSELWRDSSIYDFWPSTPLSSKLELCKDIFLEEKTINIHPNLILRLSSKLLTIQNSNDAFEILSKYTFNKVELNMTKEWLLVQAYAYTKQVYLEVSKEMKPDNIFLNGSIYHYRFGDEKCIIFFTGMSQNESGRLIWDIMPMLRRKKISLLVVVDNRHLLSLTGLYNFDLDSTITIVDDIIDALDYSKVITLGGSGNGFSALIYGILLKHVDSILGLNSVTILPKDTPGEDPVVRGYAKAIFKDKFMPYRDSKGLIDTNRNTSVLLAYSNNSEYDKKNHDRVSYFENVTLLPIDHDNHGLAGYLLEKNMLHVQLEKMIDMILEEK